MNKQICVIGGGRWGQNHIRTLSQMGFLAGIVESSAGRLLEMCQKFSVKGFQNVEQALENGFDGYILATPAETHFEIGKLLLENGQSVLIEKPLTLCSKDSNELCEIAEANGARLMVGHLLLFHPAIKKIKETITSGKLGKLHYIYSTRLNLGTIRTHENVWWSFAPHDISVLDYLVGQPALEVIANGGKFLQNHIDDTVMTQLKYPDNVKGHIFVSWLHPFKEQRLVVIGSEGMLSFEDSCADKKIMFYNKRITWDNGAPVKLENPDEIIEYENSQPLENELTYFVENLDKKFEIADGRSGHEVVKVLEKAQEYLK